MAMMVDDGWCTVEMYVDVAYKSREMVYCGTAILLPY